MMTWSTSGAPNPIRILLVEDDGGDAKAAATQAGATQAQAVANFAGSSIPSVEPTAPEIAAASATADAAATAALSADKAATSAAAGAAAAACGLGVSCLPGVASRASTTIRSGFDIMSMSGWSGTQAITLRAIGRQELVEGTIARSSGV